MKLKIVNLSKRYDEKLIFDNFSYDFEENGIYIVTGESGIGKTTLLRMIAGLDKDFSGEITGGGVKNISFAFQEYRLFPNLSAIDNVIFANYGKKSEAAENKAKEILLSLGFTANDLSLFPHELSGGMKQRVSLARAFLRDAPILLLDEPTKELDDANSLLVKEMISEISKSRLVILVTHKAEHIKFFSATQIQLDKRTTVK